MSESAGKSPKQPRWLWMFLAWFGMVILVGLGPWSWLVPAVMAGLVVTALWTRSWRPIVVLVLSPIVLAIIFGALSWFSLRPALRTFGLPNSADFFNLDPETRLFYSTWGCFIDEGEMQYMFCHNLALKCMCRVFGKPPRTYAGPYPSEEEAERRTSAAMRVPAKVFKTGVIRSGEEQVTIDAKQARAMLRSLALPEWLLDGNDLVIRVHEPPSGCLMIRITHKHRLGIGFKTDAIFLLDRRRMWPFAIYDLVTDSQIPRFPYFAFGRDVSELRDPLPSPAFDGPLY